MSEIESHAAEEPREVELKLDCAGPDLTALAAHPRLQGAAASEPELLTTTYYDTPGRELRAAGLTLRVRAQGGRHIQTVKAGSGDVGLFDRRRPMPGPARRRRPSSGNPGRLRSACSPRS